MDSYFAASMAAHISCLEGTFFVAGFRASQSTWGDISRGVCLFSDSGIEGVS